MNAKGIITIKCPKLYKKAGLSRILEMFPHPLIYNPPPTPQCGMRDI